MSRCQAQSADLRQCLSCQLCGAQSAELRQCSVVFHCGSMGKCVHRAPYDGSVAHNYGTLRCLGKNMCTERRMMAVNHVGWLWRSRGVTGGLCTERRMMAVHGTQSAVRWQCTVA